MSKTLAYDGLTGQQRAFVDAMVEGGSLIKQKDAALLAGYGKDSPDERTRHATATTAGCRLMQDPDVLAAMREQAAQRMFGGALIGASVLIEIAQDPMHKDRLKAATRLLDQAGLNIVTEHKITVEKAPDDAAMLKRIKEMALGMGLDPAQLLGSYGYVVDAEFTEVKALPAPSAAGLEDLM